MAHNFICLPPPYLCLFISLLLLQLLVKGFTSTLGREDEKKYRVLDACLTLLENFKLYSYF